MSYSKKTGRGFLNNFINKLPIELHVPGYQYCGPGTNLVKRLARGDAGINLLDAACKDHDIAYMKNPDNIEARHVADKVVAHKAWERFKAEDSGLGEKATALAVNRAMKMKVKFGVGINSKEIKKKKNTKRLNNPSHRLNKIIKMAASSLIPSSNAKTVISSALKGARGAVKHVGGKRKIVLPRILPISKKVGGFLPLLAPILAALSASGALAGGAANLYKAINDVKVAKKQLEENGRHNRAMEAATIGKGRYLKPYKKGFGLFLKLYNGKGLGGKKKLSFKITERTID